MHRNRRGPRVTNASKMDKGYTWPPDGRRRHALLCLSLSLSFSPSTYPFCLSFSYSTSLFLLLPFSRSPRADRSRFPPRNVHTCPSPTRMHNATNVRASPEGRKCTRITRGDATGMEDRNRKWTRQNEKGREGERERRGNDATKT